MKVLWTSRRSNQSILKEISPGCSLEGLIWNWNSNTLATSCEELTHLKRPWCWEILRAGGEGDDRGWDGWMASPTRLALVLLNSGSCWWTGRPGVLQSMESQTVRQNWATELNCYQYFRKFTMTVLTFKVNFLEKYLLLEHSTFFLWYQRRNALSLNERKSPNILWS